MTTVGAPLGILAFLNMVASLGCAFMPADPVICYGGREVPERPHDQPIACHATLSCAEHRRIRNIP